MGGIELCLPLPYKFPSIKIKAVESLLQQISTNFKDLVVDMENLHSENQQLRSFLDSEKYKKESMQCCSESLQREISKKPKFDSLVSVQSIKEEAKCSTEILKKTLEEYANKQYMSPLKDNKDVGNESISEIEGTPVGQKSPIIHSRKGKSQISFKDKEKTKCPEEWPTPEKKCLKLSYPTPKSKPSGRLKQARLSLIKIKNSDVVDLTCSPEYIGKSFSESEIQCNVKKDVFDNDDTILPSPTSGPIKLPVFKSLCKDSPSKLKRPQMAMKLNLDVAPNNETGDNMAKDIEDSINLLQNYSKRFKSPSPTENKSNKFHQNESVSLLQIKKNEPSTHNGSSTKQPLIENVNIINIPCKAGSSLSLRRDCTIAEFDRQTKNQQTKIIPLYKEPAVRKKAEKKALPGWSCDECRDFFDELYKDDLEMLARKMDECSKHRGRNNPVRPNTPGGFWEPRWDVPEDTEEFNRRNNV